MELGCVPVCDAPGYIEDDYRCEESADGTMILRKGMVAEAITRSLRLPLLDGYENREIPPPGEMWTGFVDPD